MFGKLFLHLGNLFVCFQRVFALFAVPVLHLATHVLGTVADMARMRLWIYMAPPLAQNVFFLYSFIEKATFQ